MGVMSKWGVIYMWRMYRERTRGAAHLDLRDR